MTGPQHFHRIYARNCEVRRIDKAAAAVFLAANHQFGDCAAACRYGIFVSRYSGEELSPASAHPYPVGTLVAVASFSKARRWEKNLPDGSRKQICSYEWLRYASLPEVRVLGGMGRVLDAFVDEFHPDDIMSYAPAEGFTGEVYETLGFVREGVKLFPNGSSSYKFRLKLTEY